MLIIIAAIVLRVFFIEMYNIPSSSMEPTLIPGDFIMVSKMSYGPRLLKLRKFFKEGKIEYTQMKGWSKVKKGDVFVFNWPAYYTLKGDNPNIYSLVVVKRCFGLPGNTVMLNRPNSNKGLYRNGMPKPNLFPHDTTLNWTLEQYGPLWIPQKGASMQLNAKNAWHYKDVMLYEGYDLKTSRDSVFLNGQFKTSYTFKNNYYFMLGDNFYGSEDSRYWGLVPENNIIGKAVLILISKDPYENSVNTFRWNRIFKFIK